MKRYMCYPAKKGKEDVWKIEENGIKKSGAFSSVSQVCRDNDCDYVIKIVSAKSAGFTFMGIIENMTPENFEKEIKKEVCLQKICAEHDLCKPVEDWWICEDNNYGVIITPLLKESIRDRFLKTKDIKERIKIVRKIIDKLHQLHKLGIYHGDIHMENMMFDKNGEIYFIDMGLSDIIDDDINLIYDYVKLIGDFRQILGNFDIMKYHSSELTLDKLENIIYKNLVNFLSEEKK